MSLTESFSGFSQRKLLWRGTDRALAPPKLTSDALSGATKGRRRDIARCLMLNIDPLPVIPLYLAHSTSSRPTFTTLTPPDLSPFPLCPSCRHVTPSSSPHSNPSTPLSLQYHLYPLQGYLSPQDGPEGLSRETSVRQVSPPLCRLFFFLSVNV
ncbi:hypothetical protein E2C01_102432 [Portunus trituberculatus]|uniref:Uncharacterized protein n=1 Tax=Portunus trituberculatus TaxID=210409 RepID=A0A5B7K873_PORTR|nr:hypothetical protein [Portunus trituberculatus]